MIPLIIGWLVKAGLSQGAASKLAKPALIVGGLLAAGLVFGLWLHFHDRGVVSTNNAQLEAHAQTEGRKADAGMAEQRRADDTRLQQESAQLERITNALPEGPIPPAGLNAARRARLRCIGLQQQARNSGGPSPAC